MWFACLFLHTLFYSIAFAFLCFFSLNLYAPYFFSIILERKKNFFKANHFFLFTRLSGFAVFFCAFFVGSFGFRFIFFVPFLNKPFFPAAPCCQSLPLGHRRNGWASIPRINAIITIYPWRRWWWAFSCSTGRCKWWTSNLSYYNWSTAIPPISP